MLNLSSRWQTLLCTTTLLLGWLIPATQQTTTSKAFKVLTDSDQLGGSCSSQIDYVNTLVPEVESLIKTAMDAINTILTKPSLKVKLSKEKKADRLRIALFAHEFFGTKWEGGSVKISDDSKETLTTVRDYFDKIKTYIDKKDSSSWRFACDDTWAKAVTELKSEYANYPVDTPISDVSILSNVGTYDYAWYDKGAENMKGVEAYITAANRWSRKGPCSGIEIRDENGQTKTVIPYAETILQRSIIYLCPRVLDLNKGHLKKSLTPYKDGKTEIATDGKQMLGMYLTPGAILLHEMTHQVFQSKDNPPLGYGFANCANGKNHPDQAEENADTYAYFAMAMYLSQYDWHTGFARKLSA